MKKFYCGLLSIFAVSSFCDGAEQCGENFKLNCDQIYKLEDDPSFLGIGCSARVCKSTYNGKPVALKIFKSNGEKSKVELETCRKILEYSKQNQLGKNLMKVLKIAKTKYNNPYFGPEELNTIVFEFIDGITLRDWLKNYKFKDTNNFIDDFCIPLICAFQEYHKITGELKHEVLSENIMMRKTSKSEWEPVLIDYGPGSGNPIYWLYNTLLKCCSYIENGDKKSTELYNFLDLEMSSGNLEMNVNSSNKLLEEIRKIRNQ